MTQVVSFYRGEVSPETGLPAELATFALYFGGSPWADDPEAERPDTTAATAVRLDMNGVWCWTKVFKCPAAVFARAELAKGFPEADGWRSA